jgi:hypothetical protein
MAAYELRKAGVVIVVCGADDASIAQNRDCRRLEEIGLSNRQLKPLAALAWDGSKSIPDRCNHAGWRWHLDGKHAPTGRCDGEMFLEELTTVSARRVVKNNDGFAL